MSHKIFLSALVGVVCCAAAFTPAVAGTKDDVRNLQERMARVEQSAAAQSAATVRISELERQIQVLTGRIEEMNYALDQANQRLASVSAALSGDAGYADEGGSSLGGSGLAPSPTGGPVDLTTGDPIAAELSRSDQGAGQGADLGAGDATPSVELPLNPDAAFDYASGFLLSGDYPRAKSAFALYIDAFPNHQRTPDAKFRLGEIHLALGENAAAADVFIDHIRSYPNDPRAAEAYLKLGTAFARLEKPSEACTVFKTMKAKFPNVSQPVSQRAELEMARINCQ